MPWKFFYGTGGVKAHAAEPALTPLLVGDLTARGYGPFELFDRQRIGIDAGGCCLAGRPIIEAVEVGEGRLPLGMPCEYVPTAIDRLRRREIRQFADGTLYVKLHSHWNAVVMKPQAAASLLSALEAIEPESVKRAEEFYRRMDGVKTARVPL